MLAEGSSFPASQTTLPGTAPQPDESGLVCAVCHPWGDPPSAGAWVEERSPIPLATPAWNLVSATRSWGWRIRNAVPPGKTLQTSVGRLGREPCPHLHWPGLEFLSRRMARGKERGERGWLWFRYHRLALCLLSFNRFSWINVFYKIISRDFKWLGLKNYFPNLYLFHW